LYNGAPVAQLDRALASGAYRGPFSFPATSSTKPDILQPPQRFERVSSFAAFCAISRHVALILPLFATGFVAQSNRG
jgi:hypothetical protein